MKNGTKKNDDPKKNDVFVAIRLPRNIRSALETERQRMSQKAGAEVKLSAALRAIIERDLKRAGVLPSNDVRARRRSA